MALCGNCGAEGTRIRSRWLNGQQLPDQCPHCAPGEFGAKFTAPSDKKIHMGFEAHPNEYEKRYDADGVFYSRKSEYRAEQEDRLRQQPQDELDAQAKAEAEKRATRRTHAMNQNELEAAVRKASIYAADLKESAERAEKERQEAELQSWIGKYTGPTAQA